MEANQLRLYFSSLGYLVMNELRRVALQGTELAAAQCHTLRLKLLKIGAVVRIHVWFASGYPYRSTFIRALENLKRAYPQLC